jgi:hypothetical protein
MELENRHPMGPLRSTDLVRLDVRLAIAEYLADTLGERFTSPNCCEPRWPPESWVARPAAASPRMSEREERAVSSATATRRDPG